MTHITMLSISSLRGKRLALLAASVAAIAATGCVDDQTAALISNHQTHHPIGFGARTETLFVEVVPSARGLSANQEADVYRFVQRYKSESTGSLRIGAPKSAGGHLAVSQSMRQVEDIVRNAGIDPRAIHVARYSGLSKHGPALKLDYDKTIAEPPQCGDWSDDLGVNRERLPYNNFGCATQRNLALTVANARDLQGPQEETPRSGERRDSQWSKYVGGDKGSASPEASSPSAAPAK